MNDVFGSDYAETYDFVYREKDYPREVEAVCQLLADHKASAISAILDAGCGTGRHAALLAQRDFVVSGIDQSESMLARARELNAGNDKVSFANGDVRSFNIGRRFDAALMMFNVIGYMTTNDDLIAAISSIRRHVIDGGLFVFDFWYGPAVVGSPPTDRVKEYEDVRGTLLRMASSVLYADQQRCDVSIRLIALNDGKVCSDAREVHSVRYFFPLEIDLALRQCGFRLATIRRFPAIEQVPDMTTWQAVAVAVAV